jgi:hypothetical protein
VLSSRKNARVLYSYFTVTLFLLYWECEYCALWTLKCRSYFSLIILRSYCSSQVKHGTHKAYLKHDLSIPKAYLKHDK